MEVVSLSVLYGFGILSKLIRNLFLQLVRLVTWRFFSKYCFAMEACREVGKGLVLIVFIAYFYIKELIPKLVCFVSGCKVGLKKFEYLCGSLKLVVVGTISRLKVFPG